MFPNTKIVNKNNIMSIKHFDSIDENTKNTGGIKNMLDVYIPRIDGRYTEEDFNFTFRALGVGITEHVDFVAKKDPETKAVLFYSAFIHLQEWSPYHNAYSEMSQKQKFNLRITDTEFWILLPAKTPITRSKVNTHQLAAYTDELFVKVEDLEGKIKDIGEILGKTTSATVSSYLELIDENTAQNKIIDAQNIKIDWLINLVSNLTKQVTNIEQFLTDKQEEEDKEEQNQDSVIQEEEEVQEIPILILRDEESYEGDEHWCTLCGKILDNEKQLHFHNIVCEEKIQKQFMKLIADDVECDSKKQTQAPINYEDECFLSPPTMKRSDSSAFNTPIKFKKQATHTEICEDIERLVVSERAVSPIIENNVRAKCSREFCGNA
jgi:hypothetical protein